MCAACPARFMFCLNTGLRAGNNAEAARGAELLQGSAELHPAPGTYQHPQDNGALDSVSLLKKLLISIML